jgi:hypothetical protein
MIVERDCVVALRTVPLVVVVAVVPVVVTAAVAAAEVAAVFAAPSVALVRGPERRAGHGVRGDRRAHAADKGDGQERRGHGAQEAGATYGLRGGRGRHGAEFGPRQRVGVREFGRAAKRQGRLEGRRFGRVFGFEVGRDLCGHWRLLVRSDLRMGLFPETVLILS